MIRFFNKDESPEMGEDELKAMGAGDPEEEESEAVLYGKAERQ